MGLTNVLVLVVRRRWVVGALGVGRGKGVSRNCRIQRGALERGDTSLGVGVKIGGAAW